MNPCGYCKGTRLTLADALAQALALECANQHLLGRVQALEAKVADLRRQIEGGRT
ncbi:MAG: hypothetical protein QME96_04560 [Myxococcota bacterium]|nr:hypothetical protein [Myxococcota bacterium]